MLAVARRASAALPDRRSFRLTVSCPPHQSCRLSVSREGSPVSELAAQLVDRVIPDVPVRQWVLSLPWSLRYQLAFDAALCRDVLAIFIRVVFGWLAGGRRRPARASPTVRAAPSPSFRDLGTAVHTATSCTNKASIRHLRMVQARLNGAARHSSLAAVSSAISSHHTRRCAPKSLRSAFTSPRLIQACTTSSFTPKRLAAPATE